MIASSLFNFLLFILICFTSANHFRMGTISFYPEQNYTEQKPQMSFTFLLGYSYVYFRDRTTETNTSWRCIEGCYESAVTVFRIKQNNSGMDWLWGGNKFTWTFKENYFHEGFDLRVEGSIPDKMIVQCKFSILSLNVTTAIRSDTKRPNASPVTNMPPVITFFHVRTKLKVVAADVDNDTIKCVLCPPDGICGKVGNISNYLSLDENKCELQYNPKPRSKKLDGYLVVALMIRDYPKKDISLHGRHYTTHDAMSSIPLTFFIQFVATARLDLVKARMLPTPSLRAEYYTQVGSLLTISPISVELKTKKNKSYPNRNVTIPQLLILGPHGTLGRPLKQLEKSNTFSSSLRWKPTANQIGAHVICFTISSAVPLRKKHIHHCVKVFVTDACFPNPCENAGVCKIDQDNVFCQCPVGFTGKRCQIETRLCERGSCWNGRCLSGTCSCYKGFSGYHCLNDINECASSPCADNAECFNSWGSYQCACKPGYSGEPNTYCTGFCHGISHQVSQDVIRFPGTWVKLTSYSLKTCKNDDRPKASVRCVERNGSSSRFFFDPETFNYLSCNATIQSISDVLGSSTNTTGKAVGNMVNELSIITASRFEKSDGVKVATILHEISKLGVHSTVDVLTNFANVASNLLDQQFHSLEGNSSNLANGSAENANKTIFTNDKEVWKERQTIIDSVLAMGKTATIPKDKGIIEIDTSWISVQVKKLVPDGTNLQGCSKKNSGKTILGNTPCSDSVTLSPLLYSHRSHGMRSTPVTLEIPAINYRKTEGCHAGDNTLPCHASLFSEDARASLVVHKTEKQSLGLKPKNPQQVIAADLQPFDTTHLKEPISITYNLHHFDKYGPNLTSFKCVFWDVSEGRWSKRGCKLDYSNSSKVVCKCDHMTTFALLVNTEDDEYDDDKWKVLTILSDVACLLSALCLVLTIAVHLSIRQIRNRRPTPIIVNLCACLLCTYLLFFFGSERTENPIICHVITAMLHWFLLCSWCWMAVYNYSLYLAFVTLLNYVRQRFWCTVSIFALGVPSVIVGASVGYFVFYIDKNNAGKESSYIMSNACWLRGDALIYTFLLPVGILLFYNLIVFFLVLRKITWKRKMVQSSLKKTGLCHEIMLGVSMAASLGLPWIFGYLMMVSNNENFRVIMSWLFTIFNASQGITIFAISCLRQQSVRKLWANAFMQSSMVKKCGGRKAKDINLSSSIVSQPPITKITQTATYRSGRLQGLYV